MIKNMILSVQDDILHETSFQSYDCGTKSPQISTCIFRFHPVAFPKPNHTERFRLKEHLICFQRRINRYQNRQTVPKLTMILIPHTPSIQISPSHECSEIGFNSYLLLNKVTGYLPVSTVATSPLNIRPDIPSRVISCRQIVKLRDKNDLSFDDACVSLTVVHSLGVEVDLQTASRCS